MYEIDPGVSVPVRPNGVVFCYTISPYSRTPELYRLLRGLAFIGGVDPNNRLNIPRLAEIPEGQGWDKANSRYNGWEGWKCITENGSDTILIAPGSTADQNGIHHVRQLVNMDGSDPWGGQCEGTDKSLVATLGAPSCWDGYNLTSPNGRDHFRYPIRKSDNSYTEVCPEGWWKVPHFTVATQFINLGHAWRSQLYLSSDRMDPNPANWHPAGSTFHFDWMNGWDSVVQNDWQRDCVGIAQNGVPGDPLTCDNSTISATQNMIKGTPPDLTLADNPIVNFIDRSLLPSKLKYGPVVTGTAVNATIQHNH